ncbi:hypothetical protein FOL47_006726, partial [Perkinsus chesapeaki]
MATPVRAQTEPPGTPLPVFDNVETVLAEIRKTRMKRGRLQGQLNRSRERIDVLIVDETDPASLEAYEELERQEQDLQRLVSEAIQRCTYLGRRNNFSPLSSSER